jgi:hypothetical protein
MRQETRAAMPADVSEIEPSKTRPLTAFTWGYWGWGTSSERFVQAADAVEKARGFAPPFFIDIRIRRSVRAPGFNGSAFERTVGRDRCTWMKSLGNRCVLEGRPGIQIDQPKAANDLFDIVVDQMRFERRVLFFCSCKFPGSADQGCHRVTVATLLLAVARRRQMAIKIVEWPGGEPTQEPLDLLSITHSSSPGLKSVVVTASASLADISSIPWYSMARVRAAKRKDIARNVLTGPARFERTNSRWVLPILLDGGLDGSSEALLPVAVNLRANGGFDPRGVEL